MPIVQHQWLTRGKAKPKYLTQINDTPPSLPCWKETQEANWNLQNKTPFKDGFFIGSMKAHQNPMVGLLGQS